MGKRKQNREQIECPVNNANLPLGAFVVPNIDFLRMKYFHSGIAPIFFFGEEIFFNLSQENSRLVGKLK